MKKVLIFDSYATSKVDMIGGSSISILDTIKELSKSNSNIEFYFLVNKNNKKYYDLYYSNLGVKEFYFELPDFLYLYGAENREKYINNKFRMVYSFLKEIIPLVTNLRRKLKKENFNVLLCNELRATLSIGLSSKFSDIRLISFIRSDFNRASLQSKFARFISDYLICISDGLYNLLNLKEQKKAILIREAIEILDIKIEKREKKIITIGNVVPYKGQKTLLEAFKLFSEKNKEYSLEIIGAIPNKEYYEELKEYIEKEKIKNVKFLGKQKNINEFLSTSCLFVLPSLNEGLGRVNLEAANNRLPIIASNLPGIKSFVIDYETGFLFEPGDVQGLHQKIEYVLNNFQQSENVADLANKKLKKEYNLAINSKEFYEFLRGI